ncbi:hypothetical protein [Nocardia sp. NBC_01388]|uniref:hypothetical protein n=1 Tax=Nocardia sp. NBC_01388 TaxID=2903596 RepID=UPI003250E3A5
MSNSVPSAAPRDRRLDLYLRGRGLRLRTRPASRPRCDQPPNASSRTHPPSGPDGGTHLAHRLGHGTARTVIAAAFDHAHARDPFAERTWVVLVDGDLNEIQAISDEPRRRSRTIHIVIDKIHVLEYLWAAAWTLHAANDPAAEDWVAARGLEILTGRAELTAATIATATQGLPAGKREGAETAVRYLRNHLDHLHYDEALARGWPIATGVIEGAARHLIGDRLEISGARWGLTGAEAILTLRTVIKNGDFEPYWKFHIAQEHARLHPENYGLAA